MDRSSFCIKKSAQGRQPRSSLWPVIASIFLLTGYSSSLGQERQIWRGGTIGWNSAGSSLGTKSPRVLPTSKVPRNLLPPLDHPSVVYTDRNAARFTEPRTDVEVSLPFASGGSSLASSFALPLLKEPDDNEDFKRRRAVYSTSVVFPLVGTPMDFSSEAEPGDFQKSAMTLPRSDLLTGVPELYAAMAVRVAAEEDVDPNWVLAVMHAENAGFDRQLVSSAGAIGLMQVMPQIGKAFGAVDLTEPEQNIRAGTRFLRLLTDKYRNPVLIASAYNAGEPRVDANHSLPLIQETADYVTRVVGYYTGMPAALPARPPAVVSQISSSSAGQKGQVERAKSPMLVFSVAEPSATSGPARHEPGLITTGGPVKVVKEEVIQ